MKIVPIGIALLGLAVLPALPTVPAAEAGIVCGRHVRWADHHDPADARCAITTEDGKVTLLLTDRVVALQLSERTLRKVRRELREKENEQDHWLGAAIVSAVVGTVGNLLDGSFECRVRDLRDVRYEDGRLEFIGRDGRRVFDDTDIDDCDLAEAFPERDAMRFVQEFRKVKAERLASR
jgi:hypothetical protein